MDCGNISTFRVEDYIKFQELLKQRCHKLKGVSEVSKLERKINAEMKFLMSLQAQDEATQKSHLKSSNLSHFSSLVHAAELLPGVVQVLKSFSIPTRADSLVVDIVASGGHAWVKVIARKAQALHLVWAGQGQFGVRDLVSQAEEYLECATRHPFDFSVPQVHFAFYNYVTQPMADCLKQMGVFVWGEVVPVDQNVRAKLESLVDDGRQSDNDSDESGHEKWNIQGAAFTDMEVMTNSLLCSEFDHNEQSSASSVGFSDSTASSAHTGPDIVKICDNSLAHTGPDIVKVCDNSSAQTGSDIVKVCDNSSAQTGSDIVKVCDTIHEPHSNPKVDIFRNSVQINCSVEKCHIPDKSSDSTCSSLQFDRLFRHLVASPPDYHHALTDDHSVSSIRRVNLDITALIAFVSSVTNGNCHFVFRDKILNLQAQEERKSPVLPVIERYLRGKQVFVCETAVSSFQSILDVLGGESEKRRASNLFSRVQVVKDDPSRRTLALDCQGQIKERSKIIFGTGDSLQAVTMTSNMGFVRAAKSQGVVFSVFLLPARALTEGKEFCAVPLPEDEHSAASL